MFQIIYKSNIFRGRLGELPIGKSKLFCKDEL